MPGPAYTRLQVDERRRQILQAGSQLFAEHSFEEITMREIAGAAGISKALLYHYYPSKTELFKAAVADHAADLQQLIGPHGDGPAVEQLARSLDAYLGWIETNSRTWNKLMRSAATLPEARELVDAFRTQTLQRLIERLTDQPEPPPVLRIAINGWLGYVDATLLDWTQSNDLPREQVQQLILDAFAAALLSAHNADPNIRLDIN